MAEMTRCEGKRGKSHKTGEEIDYLNSRIQQQSELICILKRKSDDYYEKWTQQEETKSNLEKEYRLHKQTSEKALKLLRLRFDQLSENYEELVIIKDELKERNKTLEKCNNEFAGERTLFHETLAEKEQAVDSLKRTIVDNQILLDLKERDLNEANEDLKSATAKLRSRVKTLETANTTSRLECEGAITELQAKVDKHNIRERSLLVEHDQLANKIVEMKHEQQSTNRTIAAMKEDLRTAGRLRGEAEKQRKRLEEEISSNFHVTYLKDKLHQLQDEHDQQMKEYEAFKSYTRQLLDSEQTLNANLRKMRFK